MLSTVGGAGVDISVLFHCVWLEDNCWECKEVTVTSRSRCAQSSTLDSDRIIMHVHMKAFCKRKDFKHVTPFADCKSKSLRSASIFLKSCMVEHLKWARTSPPGTDSDLIGARQAASAYLYNYVIWRLSKGRKETEKITKGKLQSENFINHIPLI